MPEPSPEQRRDEVLRRMLNTPPQPRIKKAKESSQSEEAKPKRNKKRQ